MPEAHSFHACVSPCAVVTPTCIRWASTPFPCRGTGTDATEAFQDVPHSDVADRVTEKHSTDDAPLSSPPPPPLVVRGGSGGRMRANVLIFQRWRFDIASRKEFADL